MMDAINLLNQVIDQLIAWGLGDLIGTVVQILVIMLAVTFGLAFAIRRLAREVWFVKFLQNITPDEIELMYADEAKQAVKYATAVCNFVEQRDDFLKVAIRFGKALLKARGLRNVDTSLLEGIITIIANEEHGETALRRVTVSQVVEPPSRDPGDVVRRFSGGEGNDKGVTAK